MQSDIKRKLLISVGVVVFLVTASVVLSVILFRETRASVTQKGGVAEGKTGDNKQQRPWLLNLSICPPILCGRFDPVTDENAMSGKLPGTNVERPYFFFEGDIVIVDRGFYDGAFIPDKQMSKAAPNKKSTRRKRSIRKPVKLWEGGIVYYEIHDILNKFPDSKSAILGAIKHIEERTCLKFKRKTAKDKDFVYFMYQPGCWSSVGRQGKEQIISVGPGCEYVGTVVHEIVHALGFWHEQSRRDRKKFVKIILNNMDRKFFQQFRRFNKNTTKSLGYAYDYGSIMHYGNKYYSKNNQTTIEVVGAGAKLGLTIGQRSGLSDIDIAQIKDLYGCNKRLLAIHKKEDPFDDRCYRSIDKKGRDYLGDINYTMTGITCQQWLTKYPHDSSKLSPKTTDLERKELQGHNKCRNPGGMKKRPWCYVLKSKRKWRYCSIKICKK